MIKGVDSASLTRDEIQSKAETLGIEIPDGYPIEMHKVYTAWALWGFWTQFILIIVTIASLVVANFAPIVFAYMSSITGLGWFISSLLWVIFGAIWRYSWGGTVAAGDRLVREDNESTEDYDKRRLEAALSNGYQLKSGAFLGTILTILSTIGFLILWVFAISGCLICVYGWDKDQLGALT